MLNNEFNIIINNEAFLENKDLINYMFSSNDNEKVEHVLFDSNKNIFDLLFETKIFDSKSNAKKNFKKFVEFPEGYFEFTIGKFKNKFCVWIPVKNRS